MNFAMDKNGTLSFDNRTGDFQYVTGRAESLQHVYTVIRAEKNTICKMANLNDFIGLPITEKTLRNIKTQTELALNYESPLVQGEYIVAVSIVSPSHLELRIYESEIGNIEQLTSIRLGITDGYIDVTESGIDVSKFTGISENKNMLATRTIRRSRIENL
jgi:hypothetical protein